MRWQALLLSMRRHWLVAFKQQHAMGKALIRQARLQDPVPTVHAPPLCAPQLAPEVVCYFQLLAVFACLQIRLCLQIPALGTFNRPILDCVQWHAGAPTALECAEHAPALPSVTHEGAGLVPHAALPLLPLCLCSQHMHHLQQL